MWINAAARPPPQVLDARVRVKDLGLVIAGAKVLQGAFVEAGHIIPLLRVGKWKGSGRIGTEADGRRPAVVEIDPRGAGDVRHHRIEHLPVAFVGVEAVVEEVAQKTAALRITKHIGVFRGSRSICGIPDPRRRIWYCDETETGDGRIGGCVHNLIDPAWFKAALESDRGVASELPLVPRNRGWSALKTVADRQRVFGGLRIAGRVSAQISDRDLVFSCVRREAGTHDALDALRRRHLDTHTSRSSRNVEFPSHPDDRMALSHQKSVAEFGVGRQIAGRGRAIEARQHGLVSAIHDVDQRDAATAACILRLENRQIRRELDLAGGVPGRFVQVGHDLVAGVSRIDRNKNTADDQLVRTDRAERLSGQHISPRRNLDTCHLGGDIRRHEQGQRDHCRRRSRSRSIHGIPPLPHALHGGTLHATPCT